MVRLLLTVFFAVTCALLAGAANANAQFTFTALDGLPTAQASATTALGSDAELILVGAPGSFDYQGFNLSFDITTGQSNVWGYVFHSATSGEFATYIVIRVFAYQAIELGALPFPIPDGLVSPLDASGTYANSDKMITRLATDTAFKKYRQDLPDAAPQFLSLSQLVNTDSLALPNGFPVGQGTWTVSFGGSDDSTMTCFVASKTGEAFCRRIYGLPTSSVVSENGNAVNMVVAPNPIQGRAVVRITGYSPSELANSTLLLYNSKGEVVRDLSASLHSRGDGEAEFSVEDLPSGPYHSLLIGKGLRQRVGILIIE